MGTKDDKRRVSMAETEEHLMKKLNRILHDAEDRCLTSSELNDVKDIWWTMKHIACVYRDYPKSE